MSNQEAFDATQRVYLDGDGHPTPPPKNQPKPRPPRPTPSQRAAKKRKQQRITLICLCAAALVLLIVLGIVLANALTQTNVDNGKILTNVYAAGVNIGGMTPEEAKKALHDATDNTYTKLDMTISVLDTELKLSPADTGAKLDVDAVVAIAYDLGRTGSRSEQQQAQKKAQTSGYTISVLPYLSLDTAYIQSQIQELGGRYSTLLKESSYTITGTRPSMTQDEYDTSIIYQTLSIQIGTAEYALDTNHLYEEVLDAYEINLFQVTGKCDVITPKPLDLAAIMEEAGCSLPVDATYDDQTHVVTEEIYGYGFTMDELKAAVEGLGYGESVSLDLHFVAPAIHSDYYTSGIFQDTLSYLATKLSTDSAWNANLRAVCTYLNGVTINSGEEFSFNGIVGEPTLRRGFQTTSIYLGKSLKDVTGGGICQAASMLYYCALKADLEILERHSHAYPVDFMQTGFDAEVYYGTMDLRFRNNTDGPIRIIAEVSGKELQISIIGTDSRDYTTELIFKIDETFEPGTVINTMLETNPGGYVNGDVLREGITGCLVSTYITRYDKETGRVLTQKIDGVSTSEILIAQSYYAKQDRVVVGIYTPPVEPPIDPDPGTDPENPGTDPENPGTDPENPGTDPENPGTDPENPGTDPENPGTDPENPGTDPENPGTDPENPGEGTDPTTPTDPVDPDPGTVTE